MTGSLRTWLLQPCRVRLIAPGCPQCDNLAGAAPGQLHRPRDPAGDRRYLRHHPAALPERDRPGAPQLPPHRHPVPRRLGRHPHHQHQPPPALLIRSHVTESSICYISLR